jgi:peptidoglycan hydrolase FlgJ
MMDALNANASLAMMKTANTDPVKYADIKNTKRLDEAAKDFEAVFISEMMKPMFEGLETDTMFGGGQAEEVFRSFMLQEYGKMVAQTERVGIAPHIKDAMIKLQEQQSNPQKTEG